MMSRCWCFFKTKSAVQEDYQVRISNLRSCHPSLSLTAWTGLEKVADLIPANLALCGLMCLEMEQCGALHYDVPTSTCTLAQVS